MGGLSVLFLMAILLTLFTIFMAIFAIVIVYILFTYTFESIAIARMSKNLGYKHTTTAWIPFYNKYVLGKIAGAKKTGIVLGICNFIIIGLIIYLYIFNMYREIVFLVFLILLFISFILNIVISHKVFNKVTPKYADIFTVFSVLTIGVLRPIFLFLFRNNRNIVGE